MKTIKGHPKTQLSLLLHRKLHKEKPGIYGEHYAIDNTSQSLTYITIESLIPLVGLFGYTFCPVNFIDNIRSNHTFLSQKLIAVDVDKGYPFSTLIQKLAVWNILPTFAYETFSSTEKQERYRICWVLEKAISNIYSRDSLVVRLISLCKGDSVCCDVNRLFFGGNKLLYNHPNLVLSLKYSREDKLNV